MSVCSPSDAAPPRAGAPRATTSAASTPAAVERCHSAVSLPAAAGADATAHATDEADEADEAAAAAPAPANDLQLIFWMGNCDMQVILDEDRAAEYMAKYTAKAEKMSKTVEGMLCSIS